MQAGIAASRPSSTMSTGGNPVLAPISATITEYATIAPIITTSPCAKLMSWMIPYTIV